MLSIFIFSLNHLLWTNNNNSCSFSLLHNVHLRFECQLTISFIVQHHAKKHPESRDSIAGIPWLAERIAEHVGVELLLHQCNFLVQNRQIIEKLSLLRPQSPFCTQTGFFKWCLHSAKGNYHITQPFMHIALNRNLYFP